MAFVNNYRAVGNRVDRWMRDRWMQGFQTCDTPEAAQALASRLSQEARDKRQARGLTREKKGAYGQSYPESRTRPEEPVSQRAKETAAAQRKAEEQDDAQEKPRRGTRYKKALKKA